MIFSSLQFLVFLSFFVVTIKYLKDQQKIIILFSLFFYSYWNPLFIFLILYLSAVTYICYKEKISTWFSIVLIFFPLIYFKYSDFFFNILSFEKLTSYSYKSELPLAISFITFTAVAFIIDSKKKIFKDDVSFFSFLEFIVYFPQLIAGPILRAKELIPKLKKKIIFSENKIKFGIILFVVGFVKKVYFSDSIATIIDPIFEDPSLAPPEDLIKGFLLFPIQIYFDFSGYVDMALGVSNIFSIELPVNFNRPYLTKSLTEFWRSWHITLSKWFKDYLYIPLGGSRGSKPLLFFNLMFTMSLAGLWHGANFNFILWGFLNGLLLFFEKQYTPSKKINDILKITINCFIIFNLWLIFRIQDFSILIEYISLLYANIDYLFLKENIFVLFFTILAISSQKYDNYSYIKQISTKIRLSFFSVPVIILIIILGLSFSSGTSDKFIYFDF
jgi:alginate O-acetyltransferase complex protein AlgI